MGLLFMPACNDADEGLDNKNGLKSWRLLAIFMGLYHVVGSPLLVAEWVGVRLVMRCLAVPDRLTMVALGCG